ncbi:glycosyltransferase family 2 protein [Cohnella rhizosphaerae]|uniref:Glycosyltransferase family 2 protein n=1 Tax=Cohnella rhizosphaerae TaxID=1457232 RepID=A0A9X4QSE9_9BACL|nr:glycosyltransferase family 2 protein [Cohnella rhizosphaerae]MDG0808467.1 glycosyltransferase family 2 protein [Cohnella rhizosphaerae]
MKQAETQAELLIIVPAFNEAEGIRGVLADIRSYIPDADIVVVNDGSSDATAAEAAAAGAAVITLSCNLGIGGAVQTGYRYAAERGYRLAAQMDGDGQHLPEEMGRMRLALAGSGADMVVGSRFVERRGFQSSRVRRMGIALLAGLLTRLLGREVTDPTSGFRLCGPRAIALFAADYPTDYPEVEALVEMDNAGLRCVEVPVVMRERRTGTSSISPFKSVYYMCKVTVAVLIAKTRKKKWSVRYET